jgi:hypothetical protein
MRAIPMHQVALVGILVIVALVIAMQIPLVLRAQQDVDVLEEARRAQEAASRYGFDGLDHNLVHFDDDEHGTQMYGAQQSQGSTRKDSPSYPRGAYVDLGNDAAADDADDAGFVDPALLF